MARDPYDGNVLVERVMCRSCKEDSLNAGVGLGKSERVLSEDSEHVRRINLLLGGS